MSSVDERKTGELVLRSFGWTDVGKKRQANEDFYSIVEDAELFILADGMGGHSSGEVASRLAVRHLVEFLVDLSRREDFEYASDVPPIDDPHERLVHAGILYANERVYIESMKDRAYEGMGTTLLVGFGAGDRIVFAHVGDSRIYRLRDGKLTQITEDHSWINHLIRTGQMTKERAVTAKGKNVIMRAVGLKGSVVPDIQSVERRAGDLYLFCSDGLSDLVEDWILENMLRTEGHDLYACARSLIKIANDYGGKDNITVILLRVLEVGQEDKSQGLDSSGKPLAGIFDVDTDKIALGAVADAAGSARGPAVAPAPRGAAEVQSSPGRTGTARLTEAQERELRERHEKGQGRPGRTGTARLSEDDERELRDRFNQGVGKPGRTGTARLTEAQEQELREQIGRNREAPGRAGTLRLDEDDERSVRDKLREMDLPWRRKPGGKGKP